jgi:hypothetical protein
MRVFAYHDAEGRITSLLAVNAPQGITLMAAGKPGEFVSEISAEDLSELTGTELMDRLREVGASSLVDHGSRQLRHR